MDRERVFLSVCRKTRCDNVGYQHRTHPKVSFILSSVINPKKVALERTLSSGGTNEASTLLVVKTRKLVLANFVPCDRPNKVLHVLK